MLVIQVKDGENIEKALKKYKRKFDKTQVVKNLRNRQKFIKPSVVNRTIRLKAAYSNQIRLDQDV